VAAEAAGGEITVHLRNAGDRPGREVVQVYASKPAGAVERPPRWLAGFAVVEAGRSSRDRRVAAEVTVEPASP
jgi:beta-glucosidase